MKSEVLRVVKGVLTVASTVVLAIELLMGGGNGEAKKKEAIAKLQQALDELDANVIDLPDWALSILKNEAVLGLLIDAIVSFFNRTGFFSKQSN